ncbi:MAG TPA: hypothetical protein VMD75_17830 [Candidatus Binataceae bacterium]|nr:hypothetical protein [Candidatus Binataceae bacterium]
MNLKQLHPDEPWLWRAQWAAGELHSSAKPGALAVSALALLWNLIALPAVVPTLLAHDLRREPEFVPFTIFPLIAVVLIGAALHLILRWRVYGASCFQMKAVPGQIGGTLAGSIHVERGLRPMRRVMLKLTCINRTGSAKTIWSDEAEVAVDDACAIPVALLIPSECRPTDDTNSGDSIFWQLGARASGGLVNYKSNFEVPIFRIAETAAQAADADDLRVLRDQRVSAFRPQGSAISVGLTGDGHTRIHFRAFRDPSVIFALLGFLAIWSGLTYLVFREHAPLIFKIMWPGFEAIFLIWGISMMFGSTSVLVGNGELSVTRRLFGIPVSTRRVPSSDVHDVRSITGMTAGSTAYRRIQVRYGSGGQLNFGDGIRDPIEADWIAAKIVAALGLASAVIRQKTVA